MINGETGKARGWMSRSLIKIILDYAEEAWQQWLSVSRMQQLNRKNDKTLRFVTGKLELTSLGAPRAKTGIRSCYSGQNAHALPGLRYSTLDSTETVERFPFSTFSVERCSSSTFRVERCPFSALLDFSGQCSTLSDYTGHC